MSDYETARARMVERQLIYRGIRDPLVLDAMLRVPRHEFVAPNLVDYAYDDRPLPIEDGQTISQPYIVALMVEAARLDRDATVLEVGTGSGYAAAVMAELAGRVVTIERHAGLAESARVRLARLGYDTVEVVTGDGTLGWPGAAPYQAIIAAASGPRVPQAWLDQLAVGGRIVTPLGAPRGAQHLLALTRVSEDEMREENLGGVSFVPLLGEQGWPTSG
ncbi:MAG TPA: protein-L-isoaspartate(D-aspartate) O-methyltransferase [Microbacteriaceae bacterium]|nr:protein-L-isoaspartate(D-aspartate) O-methyltransferase [Microbacteriaceae bacterium]